MKSVNNFIKTHVEWRMQAIALITNCPKCGRELSDANYITKGDTLILVCQCGYVCDQK